MSVSCSGRSKKKERCLNEELHPLEEVEACPCDEFLSQPYGDWSACVLPDRSAHSSLQGWMSRREVKECGQGLRFRAVACLNQRGHLVEPTLCTQAGIQTNTARLLLMLFRLTAQIILAISQIYGIFLIL